MASGTMRVVLWGIALAWEYAAPALRYWVPGLGRSSTTDWAIAGGHLGERFGLFIIIALGESILVTGATFSAQPWNTGAVLAFIVAFIGSVAMWWIYFDTGAERGAHRLEHDQDPGRLARTGYTYLHLPIVAGIIVSAVADELLLAHPAGHIDTRTAWAIIGGPALYVLGNLAFKYLVVGRVPLSHMVGLLLLGTLVPLLDEMSPLALASLVTLALIVTAGWETWALRRASLRAEPG
jgi:low temperature requirement protein LtrA